MLWRWRIAKIMKKIWERIAPALANGYSPAAVSGVVPVFLVTTPAEHGLPIDVATRLAFDTGVSVRSDGGDYLLPAQTPATLCMTGKKITADADGFVAALAPAKPHTVVSLAPEASKGDDGESAERLVASQVLNSPVVFRKLRGIH
jgi:hypothetical protein